MGSSLGDVQRAGSVEHQFWWNSGNPLPGHFVTVQVQNDIRGGNSDYDFGPFLRQLWHREFRHLLRMRMHIGISVYQRDILIGTWAILWHRKFNI